MKNLINPMENPTINLSQMTTATTGKHLRRTWSNATALKLTIDMGKSYPGYKGCKYRPCFSDQETSFWLTSYNQDADGVLHCFTGKGKTLEMALVMLNEDLKAFFIKGEKRPSLIEKATAFEQVIEDTFFTDNRTPFIAA